MKLLGVFVFLLLMPTVVLAMEQSFTRQGMKTTVVLTPDTPDAGSEVQLKMTLEQDGARVTDREVTLQVFQGDQAEPILDRDVDVLDGQYVDSWRFAKPGEYRVAIGIAGAGDDDDWIDYQVKATVVDSSHDHGFFSHHFGSHWGWWGAGMMILMMVPMIVLM
ncbi:hypothetical protein L4X63_18470 [Geomonas sp. Red32]|nr:hypothetical protein [Geomonas sp. Red32]